MQKLFLGRSNRVFLDTDESIDAVKLSIASPTGTLLKDSGEADFDEIVCTFDSSSGKYYLDVTFSSSTSADDAYLFWQATLSAIAVTLESKNDPEDAVIVATVSTDHYLVSTSFILDNFLRGISEADIAASYPGLGFREAVRSQILVATDELQRKVKTFFVPTTITEERHDYDHSPLYEKYWTQKLYETPIISVSEMKLMLKDQEIAVIPAAWLEVGNLKEGLVKVIPYAGGAGSGFTFRLIMTIGANLGLVVGGTHYIPDFFLYNYQAGLDWDNLGAEEKTSIKNAIGRHVALNMLPNLDVHRGIASESRSIDGASASRSYTSSAIYGEHSAALEKYEKQEKTWVDEFKGRYLKRLILDGF